MKEIQSFVLAFFISINVFSQIVAENINSYVPPSPEVASLTGGSHGSGVDLFTGKLNQRFPLSDFTIGGVKFPIALNYSTSGFKVQEVSGVTGLGWSHNMGGVITRYVENKPDEEDDGYCGLNRRGGNNYSPETKYFIEQAVSGAWDTQPDKFVFSFLGFNGVFMLDPDGIPVMQSSGLTIEYSPFNRVNGRRNGGAEEWKVRDEQGNLYTFGQEFIEVTTSIYHGENENTSRTFISSWYLKSILTAKNQTVNFSYLTGAPVSFTNYVNARRLSLGDGTVCDIGTNSGEWHENVNVSIAGPLYLNSISDNSKSIVFGYDLLRDDLANSKALTSLSLKVSNTVSEKHVFSYGYFLSSDGTNTKRLKLSSVQRESTNQSLLSEYEFFYNETVNLPARNSLQTDFWGYYNSNSSPSNIHGYQNCDKSPDINRTKANVLTKVIKGTGGTLNFDYQQNECLYGGANNKLSGGLRIHRIYEKTSDLSTLILNSQEYFYNKPGSDLSSGVEHGVEDYNRYRFKYLCPLTYNGVPVYITPVGDEYTYSDPVMRIDNSNIEYSNVSVKNVDGSMIRYTFTDNTTHPDLWFNYSLDEHGAINARTSWSLVNTPTYSLARGKPTLVEYINTQGVTIKKNTLTYGIGEADARTVIGYKACVDEVLPDRVRLYAYSRYILKKRDIQLISSKDEFFSDAGILQQEVQQNYTYSTTHPNLINSISTTLSNGNIKKISYKYVFDIMPSPSSGIPVIDGNALYHMLLSNNISSPIEEVTSIQTGSIVNVISAKVSVFKYEPTTAQLYQVLSLDALQPIPISQYASYQVVINGGTGTLVKDPRLNVEKTFVKYDSKGNLLEMSDKVVTTSYLYDKYSNVMAQALGAGSGAFGYTSFESDDKGGWLYNAPNAEIKAGGVTGSHCFSGIAVFQGGGKVSLWAKGKGSITVNNVNQIITPEWKHYEWDNFSYNGYLVVNTNGNKIDELRVYQGGQITTYAYDSFGNVVGSSDKSKILTKYEYDSFNRLKNIKDSNGNIVRNYKYHRYNQPVEQDLPDAVEPPESFPPSQFIPSMSIQERIVTENIGLTEQVVFTGLDGGKAEFASTFLWNFGDGTTSTEQSGSHTYQPGKYTVTLTVSNPEFPSQTFTKVVKVYHIRVVNLNPEEPLMRPIPCNDNASYQNTYFQLEVEGFDLNQSWVGIWESFCEGEGDYCDADLIPPSYISIDFSDTTTWGQNSGAQGGLFPNSIFYYEIVDGDNESFSTTSIKTGTYNTCNQ